MEYTKGEWKFDSPYIKSGFTLICTMIEPDYIPDTGDKTWYNRRVEVMEGDATLMTASLPMYEALREVRTWMNTESDIPAFAFGSLYRWVNEALQKAEGNNGYRK